MTTWELVCALYCDELVVLGTKCSAHDCDEVATFNVAWPGRGTSPQCTSHRDWATKIADAMGFDLQSTPRIVREPGRVDDASVRFAMMELDR